MGSEVVPNPIKEVRISFQIDEVRKAVKSLVGFSKIELTVDNDTMNYYQISTPASGLDLGLHVEICLHKVSDTETVLKLEGRRRHGWIDTWGEAYKTYGGVNGVIALIGKSLRGELNK